MWREEPDGSKSEDRCVLSRGLKLKCCTGTCKSLLLLNLLWPITEVRYSMLLTMFFWGGYASLGGGRLDPKEQGFPIHCIWNCLSFGHKPSTAQRCVELHKTIGCRNMTDSTQACQDLGTVHRLNLSTSTSVEMEKKGLNEIVADDARVNLFDWS